MSDLSQLIERIEAEMVRCADQILRHPVGGIRAAYREAAAEYATILIALKDRATLQSGKDEG